MDFFVPVNSAYSTYFGSSPPARACVAVDLHPPVRLKLDCIAYAEGTISDRRALHVQGLSYWAPANIGPYSQAVVVGFVALTEIWILSRLQVDERVWISGQIGLIPSSLSLPSPRSLAMETALSFQAVERVKRAQQSSSGGGWVGHTQMVLYWLQYYKDLPLVQKACALYKKVSKLSKRRFSSADVLSKGPRAYAIPRCEGSAKRCTCRETSSHSHRALYDI